MSVDIFGMKSSASSSSGGTSAPVESWSSVLNVSSAGNNLSMLKNLYEKRAETSINYALTLASTLDGPVQVHRFGDVTLNGATITCNNPCRGLFLIFDSLTTTGSASTIHMNGMGCVNYDWPDYDLSIPPSINLASNKVTYADLLSMIKTKGYYVGDPQLWNDLSSVVTAGIVPGTNLIIDKATGLGAPGAGDMGAGTCTALYWRLGGAGGAGSKGPGGGSGASASVHDNYTTLYCGRGEPGHSWRGGFGGAGRNVFQTVRGGRETRVNAPGGVLVVAVLNSATLGASLTLAANALYTTAAGPDSTNVGANGGGRVFMLTPSTISSNLTLQANGATSTTYDGAACYVYGGAGTATQSTLTAWGV